MASVEQRATKSGTSWRLVWRRPHAKDKEYLTFYDDRDAVRCRKLVEGLGHDVTAEQAWRQHNGIPEPHLNTGGGMTLGEWAAKWFPAKSGVEIGTVEKYRRNYEMHVAPVQVEGVPLCEYPLTAITPLVYSTWVATSVRAGVGPGVLQRTHVVFGQMLRDAVREKLLTENASAHASLPRADQDEDEMPQVFLTHAEAHNFVDAMPDGLGRDVAVTLLGTGMRWGELTALQGRDLTRDGRFPAVRVQRAWKYAPSVGWYLGPPKSKRSRRTLTITAELADLLTARVSPSDPEALLFRNRVGNRVALAGFRRDTWDRAVALASGWGRHKRKTVPVPRAPALAKFPTPHDLRHTHASWLIADGVHLVRVSRRLGHESVATTERIYIHLLRDDDVDMLDGLDRALKPR